MATYTRSNVALPTGLHWADVTQLSVLSTSATVMRLRNTDGTITEVLGTGFTFDGSNNATAGSVTSMRRLSSTGITVLEDTTGLNHPLPHLLANTSDWGRVLLAGNDTMTGGSLGDEISGFGGNDALAGGNGDDILIGRSGADSLNGGTGIDAASYAGSTAGVTVNLTTGAASGGHAAGDTFTAIENLVGSDHADTLTGNARDNLLNGGLGNDGLWGGGGNDTLAGDGGNDTLTGGAGGDALSGGAGTDAASYATSTAGVTVNLATGAASGGHAAGDTLQGIENLIGSSHADTLTGNFGNNALSGGDGNDTLIGAAGADALNGGAGIDAASYAGSNAGVRVHLALGGAAGGDADGDTFTGIDALIGSAYSDHLAGDAGDNHLYGEDGNDALWGGDGNDIIIGGAGIDGAKGGYGNDTFLATANDGKDVYNGGAGSDTYDLSQITTPVTIRLGTNFDYYVGYVNGAGAARGSQIGTDYVELIENVIGGAGADIIHGDNLANRLEGGAGNDTLRGFGGADTFVFRPEFGSDTILVFDANPIRGQDVLDISAFGITSADFAARVAIGHDGMDTMVTVDGGDTIRLSGINHATVTIDDFLFVR
jgi:Ca2+-binding RTX toxin-like protein